MTQLTTVEVKKATATMLNYAIAKHQGMEAYIPAFASRPWVQLRSEGGVTLRCPQWASDFCAGGLLMEQEGIGTQLWAETGWLADYWNFKFVSGHSQGKTLLMAVTRCYLTKHVGATIEVPDCLLRDAAYAP